MKVIGILLAAIILVLGVICATVIFTGRQEPDDSPYEAMEGDGSAQLHHGKSEMAPHLLS